MRGILEDHEHRETKIWLLDVNRYLEDILCREELHQLLLENKERYRLHHTLTGKPAPPEWEYSAGRVNEEMLQTHLPRPDEERMVCICGPPAMEQTAIGQSRSFLFLYMTLLTPGISESLTKMGWNPITQLVIF